VYGPKTRWRTPGEFDLTNLNHNAIPDYQKEKKREKKKWSEVEGGVGGRGGFAVGGSPFTLLWEQLSRWRRTAEFAIGQEESNHLPQQPNETV
jgi:hypothetical protein